MKLLGWLSSVSNFLLNRAQVEQDLAEEIETHIAARTEQLMHRGLAPQDARRQAAIEFGNREKYKEECRESLGARLLHDSISDIRYALRTLRHNPLLTTVLLLCLGIGIGANCAIFSVANAVLVRSLPIQDPEQLTALQWQTKKAVPDELRDTGTGYGNYSFSYQTYEKLQQSTSRLRPLGITGVLAYVPMGFSNPNVKVVVQGRPAMASGELVTADYFSVLGVGAQIGRTIAPADLEPGAPLVVVISDRYWQDSFARDPAAIGSALNLNGLPATIVGAARPGFFGLNSQTPADLWAPMRGDHALFPWGASPQPNQTLTSTPGWWYLPIFVRHRDGLTLSQVEKILTPLFRGAITENVHKTFAPRDLPSVNAEAAAGGFNFLRNGLSTELYVLMGAVLLLLLIGCTNVATLLLARAVARQREMSIRLATGASRSRIVRQVLTESLLLSCAGGALGVALALWGSKVLLILICGPDGSLSLDVHPDAHMLAFSLVISVLTGLLFGVGPAFKAIHADPFPALKETTRSLSGRSPLAAPLVTVQIAFSLLLLIVCGLLIQTLRNLHRASLGFQAENLLVFQLDPRSDGFKDVRLLRFYNDLTQKLDAIPGVRSATVSGFALMSGWSANGGITTDFESVNQVQDNGVFWNAVGPDYLRTMGIAKIFGSDFTLHDIESRRRVAIINETLAKKYFLGISPLGRHFAFGPRLTAESWEIIGVAADAKFNDLREKPPATAYVSYAAGEPTDLRQMTFTVSGIGNPIRFVEPARRAVASLDSQLPLIRPQTQQKLVDDSIRHESVFARLSTAFALLSISLAAVGLYGHLAYSVTRRTGEIGIRIALGAVPRDVIWISTRNAIVCVSTGTLIGCLLAWASTRLIASTLYGVEPMAPEVIGASVLALSAISTLAAALPAWRASRINPIAALRHE